MKQFLSVNEHTPPAPGRYWTRTDLKTVTGKDGVTCTHYRQDWMMWDGTCWIGGNPTHFYGEKERVTA